jgi:NADPH2:quinone reductase
VIYPARECRSSKAKTLAEAFKKACGGGADVVYDAVGGDYCEPALRAMNWNGRYLVIGFPAGIPTPPLNLTLLKSSSIVGVFWGAALRVSRSCTKAMCAISSSSTPKARSSRASPRAIRCADGGKAIRALMDRTATGKLVVTME